MNKLICCYSQYISKNKQDGFKFVIKYTTLLRVFAELEYYFIDYVVLSKAVNYINETFTDSDKLHIDSEYNMWKTSPESLYIDVNKCRKCKYRYKCYTRN